MERVVTQSFNLVNTCVYISTEYTRVSFTKVKNISNLWPAIRQKFSCCELKLIQVMYKSLRFNNQHRYVLDFERKDSNRKSIYILWSVNDVTGKDFLERHREVSTSSVEVLHLERPLKRVMQQTVPDHNLSQFSNCRSMWYLNLLKFSN